MSSEKTEKPSPKRLKEAREKGNIPRSKDLAVAVASVASTAVFVTCGHLMIARMSSAIAEGTERLGRSPMTEVKPDEMTGIVMHSGWLLAMLVGPIAVAAAGAGVFAMVAQGGFNFAPAALTPSFDRLNPANGIRRLSPK